MLLALAPYTLRRFGVYTTGSDGRRVRGALTTSTISADVQPLNGKELSMLEEGARMSDTRKAYTSSELRTDDQHANVPADELTIDGANFKVLKVERQIALLPHYKATLIRVGEPV